MKKAFWCERWQKGKIGFHEGETNYYLKNSFNQLKLAKGSTVFVPLCGKTQDLLWLSTQGYQVIGVEVSPIAVESFFNENNLTFKKTQQNKFTRWETENITILCGDFFDLTVDELNQCDAIYDRAALIALPEKIREKYTQQLLKILPKNCSMFLITLTYDQTNINIFPPPFSVTELEVKNFYHKHFNIQKIKALDIIEDTPRFKKAGLTALIESVYIATNKKVIK